jgi:hypothetical protein
LSIRMSRYYLSHEVVRDLRVKHSEELVLFKSRSGS